MSNVATRGPSAIVAKNKNKQKERPRRVKQNINYATVRIWPGGLSEGNLFSGEYFKQINRHKVRGWVQGYALGSVKKFGWVQDASLDNRGRIEPHLTPAKRSVVSYEFPEKCIYKLKIPQNNELRRTQPYVVKDGKTVDLYWNYDGKRMVRHYKTLGPGAQLGLRYRVPGTEIYCISIVIPKQTLWLFVNQKDNLNMNWTEPANPPLTKYSVRNGYLRKVKISTHGEI
ncbi:MAG: hypothetical protein ACYC6M_15795 [Terriglobales bacterium]